jgi:K+/H+ antiporter YhaU regulatory subunit KhtT
LPWFVPEFDSQDSFGIWYKAVVQMPVTMQELNMRAKTGASILAINRSGLTIPYPDSSVEIRPGDQLYVVGTSSAQNEIKNTFLQLQAVEKNG